MIKFPITLFLKLDIHHVTNTKYLQPSTCWENNCSFNPQLLLYIFRNFIILFYINLITTCWGLFFRPTWHYFIGNPCHINILLIFWVNLFKTQNKLIFYSTTWIELIWPARSLLQEANSWSTFPLHQIGIITPRYYQHQHMDWVSAINQSSQPILPLLHSWQATSSTRAHFYTK